jgi:hypothetical protein
MTEEYYCKCCNYHTDNKWHFSNHLDSNTHTDLISKDNNKDTDNYKKKIFCCKLCTNVYLSKRSLDKHFITCSENSQKTEL